jgi:hypothetical protein
VFLLLLEVIDVVIVVIMFSVWGAPALLLYGLQEKSLDRLQL